jgi:hypothetical protein
MLRLVYFFDAEKVLGFDNVFLLCDLDGSILQETVHVPRQARRCLNHPLIRVNPLLY